MSPPVPPLRLERWALAAWPALEEIRYDGWILRFADGHTKRANSVNPLGRSTIDPAEKIAACERAYDQRSLPTIFRLTPFSEPLALDEVLAARGYAKRDRTWVMTKSLDDLPTPGSADAVRSVALAPWLDAFERLGVLPSEEMRIRRRIVGRIPFDRIPLVAGPVDRPVGIHLGVRDGEAVGLFALFVTKAERRRGIGRALVEVALWIAAACGARIAYLQVEERNEPAMRLYEKLGFAEAYPYWYRIRATDGTDPSGRARRGDAVGGEAGIAGARASS